MSPAASPAYGIEHTYTCLSQATRAAEFAQHMFEFHPEISNDNNEEDNDDDDDNEKAWKRE